MYRHLCFRKICRKLDTSYDIRPQIRFCKVVRRLDKYPVRPVVVRCSVFNRWSLLHILVNTYIKLIFNKNLQSLLR